MKKCMDSRARRNLLAASAQFVYTCICVEIQRCVLIEVFSDIIVITVKDFYPSSYSVFSLYLLGVYCDSTVQR